MTTAETRQNGLRRLRKFTANPLKSLCEDVLRRLRRFIAKSLIFLAKVCEAKVPHTPYELPQRFSALRSSLQEGSERAGRAVATGACCSRLSWPRCSPLQLVVARFHFHPRRLQRKFHVRLHHCHERTAAVVAHAIRTGHAVRSCRHCRRHGKRPCLPAAMQRCAPLPTRADEESLGSRPAPPCASCRRLC